MPTPFPFVSGAVLTAANLNSISELPTRTLTSSGAAVAADAYSRVILNGTSITYTINTSTFAAGQVVELYNANLTLATIAAGAGITLNGAAGLTLAQYQTAELYAISATSFVLWKSDRGTGQVLQVASTTKTDTFTTTSTSFTDITGLSVSITPSTTTSKFLVMSNWQASVSGDIAVMFRLMRDSTAISIGDAAGSRTRASASLLQSNITEQLGTFSVHVLDSPATTSATTYKVQMFVNTGTGYIGRTGSDADSATRPRTASTITVMEISA